MINNFTVDTGTPRHVVGHAVSGAAAVGIASGVLNARACQKEEITKEEAIKNTLKDAITGGVATATAITVANTLGDPRKSLFQTLGALALGAGAVYAIEKANEKVTTKETVKEVEHAKS